MSRTPNQETIDLMSEYALGVINESTRSLDELIIIHQEAEELIDTYSENNATQADYVDACVDLVATAAALDLISRRRAG